MRKLIAILAASALFSGLSLATESSLSYAATSNVGVSTGGRTVRVIVGSDRYDTAVLVSQAGFPQGAPAVVITRGDDFADALCGAPLAHAYGGPLLLTPASGLPGKVVAELERLHPSHVFLIGIGGASSPVLKQVMSFVGPEGVTTLVGRDRYETAALVADQLRLKAGSPTKVIIAPGDSFADALAVAPLAAVNHWPILYTPRSGNLPQITRDEIAELGVDSALEIGTYARIDLPNVVRLAGADRYDTCAQIAQFALAHGLTTAHVAFVTGEKFPDGLAAAPYLALDAGILLLTGQAGATPAVTGFLSPRAAGVRTLEAIGLTAVPAGPWLSTVPASTGYSWGTAPTPTMSPPASTTTTVAAPTSTSVKPTTTTMASTPTMSPPASTTTTVAAPTSTTVKPTTTALASTPTTLPQASSFDLKAAVAACPAGGTVNLPEGTITLDSTVTLKSGVTLKGQGMAVTVVKATADFPLELTGTTGVTLEAFTLQGRGQRASGEQYGISVSYDGTASKVTLRSLEATGFSVAGFFGASSSVIDDLLVEGCVFHNCGEFGIAKGGTKTSSRWTIRNTKAFDFAGTLYPPHGIYLHNINGLLVEGCEAYGPLGDRPSGYSGFEFDDCQGVIRSCYAHDCKTTAANGFGFIVLGTGDLVFDNCRGERNVDDFFQCAYTGIVQYIDCIGTTQVWGP